MMNSLAAAIVRVALGLALVSTGGAIHDAKAWAQEAATTERWKGSIELPGGAGSLDFLMEVKPGEPMSATMSIPAQGVKSAALKEFTVDGEVMTWTFGVPPMPEATWARFSVTKEAGVGTASGTMQQSGMSMKVSMTRLAEGEAAEKPRPQDPKAPFPYSAREVSYTNPDDGVKLAGTLTVPEEAKFGAGPFAAALLITGSGPQDRDELLLGHRPFLVLADHLTRAGIVVLRVDDRGVGGSTSARPGEETTLDYVGDVQAGVEFLTKQPEVDAKRVGLIGHSEGGLIAPMVAARTKDVAFVVLLAGTGVNGRQVLTEQLVALMKAEGIADDKLGPIAKLQERVLAAAVADSGGDEFEEALREAASAQAELTGQKLAGEALEQTIRASKQQMQSPWMQMFLKLEPAESLQKTAVPVLALNGALDRQVVASQNIPAIARALLEGGNEDVTLRVMPGLNHLFQTARTGAFSEYATIDETFAPAALETISEWLVRKFGQPKPVKPG